jgi:hypothetical protein
MNSSVLKRRAQCPKLHITGRVRIPLTTRLLALSDARSSSTKSRNPLQFPRSTSPSCAVTCLSAYGATATPKAPALAAAAAAAVAAAVMAVGVSLEVAVAVACRCPLLQPLSMQRPGGRDVAVLTPWRT